MSRQITDVQVGGGAHDSRYWLGCVYNGARYHVWIDRATGEVDADLHKNPPIGVEQNAPEFYWTRRLSVGGATGRKVLPAMIAARDEENLVQKWLAQLAAEAEQERIQNEQAALLEKMEAAAPQLVEALRAIAKSDSAEGRLAGDALRAAGIPVTA